MGGVVLLGLLLVLILPRLGRALPWPEDPVQARLPLAWEESPPEDARQATLPPGCLPRVEDVDSPEDSGWERSSRNAWRGRSWSLEGAGAEGAGLRWLETPPLNVRRGTRLSFRMRLVTESPRNAWGGHDGWDGVSVWAAVDGGPWRVLEGFRPGYDCASLAAGGANGLGAGLPGWSGRHEWRKFQKDLGALAGRQVVLRLVLACDERDPQDGPASHFQVDDFRVQAGRRLIFHDDAEGPSSQGALKPGRGRVEDPWRMAPDASAWSWTAREGRRTELWSGSWIVPDEGEGWLTFRIAGTDSAREDMRTRWSLAAVPDDGSPEETLWTGRLAGRRSVAVSLEEWAGRSLRLRWSVQVVRPVGMADGSLGTLELSSLGWWIRPRPERDVELEDLLVAWPRREGQPCEILLRARNLGREAVGAVDLRLSLDGRVELDVPSARGLAPGEQMEAVTAWVPPAAGEHDLLAWLRGARDQVHGNDSLRACAVEVAAEREAEFGYSHSPATVCFPVGDPMVRVEDPLLLEQGFLPRRVTVGFVDPDGDGRQRTVRLHLLEDAEGSPGRGVWSSTYRLSDPGREFLWEFETDSAPELQGPFWLWVERLDGAPHVLGAPQAWKPGHAYLRLHDDDLREVDQGAASHELLVWVAGDLVEWPVPEASEPQDLALLGAVPNPFNPSTLLSFRTEPGERFRLSIYNLAGQEVAHLADGVGTGDLQVLPFDGSRLASGVYFARLESATGISTLKLVLSK